MAPCDWTATPGDPAITLFTTSSPSIGPIASCTKISWPFERRSRFPLIVTSDELPVIWIPSLWTTPAGSRMSRIVLFAITTSLQAPNWMPSLLIRSMTLRSTRMRRDM